MVCNGVGIQASQSGNGDVGKTGDHSTAVVRVSAGGSAFRFMDILPVRQCFCIVFPVSVLVFGIGRQCRFRTVGILGIGFKCEVCTVFQFPDPVKVVPVIFDFFPFFTAFCIGIIIIRIFAGCDGGKEQLILKTCGFIDADDHAGDQGFCQNTGGKVFTLDGGDGGLHSCF